MTELICIVCPQGCHLHVDEKNEFSVTGNSCARGEAYGKTELTNPTRTVTSTVRVCGAAHRRCPVKTSAPIPKACILSAVELLDGVTLEAPILLGQPIVKNICGTGIDFIATQSLPASCGSGAMAELT